MKIILILMGTVLLLLFLLLWIPLRFSCTIKDQETHVFLRWLFLKIPLYPQPEEQESKKEQPDRPPKEKEKKEKKKSSKKIDSQEMARTGFLLLQSSIAPLRRLLKSIVVEQLVFHWWVTGEDAAQTAISVGRYNAIVGGAYGTASLLLTMRAGEFVIQPDFLGEQDRVELQTTVRTRPGMALAMGVSALGVFLWRFLKEKRRDRSDGQGAEPTSTKSTKEQMTTETIKEAVCEV